jgi:hypothetical protein
MTINVPINEKFDHARALIRVSGPREAIKPAQFFNDARHVIKRNVPNKHTPNTLLGDSQNARGGETQCSR